MVDVVHRHAEDLPRRHQGLAVEGIADPARTINCSAFRGVGEDREDGVGGALMLALIVHFPTASTSCQVFAGLSTLRKQSVKLGFGEGSRQPETGQDTPVAKPGDCRDLVLGQSEDQKAPCPPDR